jgi:Cys-rich repeat protein
LLSIIICNECNENLDCDAGDICVDNECVPAPPECVADGDCAAGEVCDAGECVPGGGCQVDGDCASNEVCDAGECVVGDCTGDGDCDDADDCTSDNCVSNSCVHTAEPVGTVCGTDGQCTSDGGCTEGSCTNTDDSTYVCSPAGEGIKGALTACGLCEILGGLVPALCPLLCDGSQSPPSGPAAVCAANTLLLGGNGGACTDGLSQGCLTCYADVAACGTANCAASCSGSGAIGANGCTCIDCVNTNCDEAFTTCAGYPTGRPNGTPSGTGGVVGGPPACEGIPTPACDE